MSAVLDFEKPIMEIQEKIEELRKISLESGMDFNKEIETFEQQAEDCRKELYSNLKPSQKLQIARHPERPNFLDYVNNICEDFVELHGDREGMDDRAIIGGLAKIDGRPVMIIGTMKGKSTKENLEYNFGMPQPQGYRKALRLFKHASKFNIPIVTLIDTPGAYPGISYYTVISPEGCASILWRDATKAADAADALKITAKDLMKFNIIDGEIKEPVGGAHTNYEEVSANMKKTILDSIDELLKLPVENLKEQRYQKFRKMGAFLEG